ncbi:DUF2171 domain-containing protein [Sphingomonas sp. IC-56]|uniref:DUF2171 domain-containing protein n=1 Tax=Sphingomonas sp. IC-56 TaxID=2898529 RepID=UPI001E55E549|nr:DUF2171 domain-containing protein [Sphingomonas sp. IC-56]MCD2324034.1 DUF2171 domain-containing protein [Sphingomonas sp. IC-56]
MDDRNNRYGRSGSDQGRDYGSGRDYTYSSARDYAAAGMRGDQGRERGGYGRGENRDSYRDDSRWNERSGYGGQTRDWGGGEHSSHGDDHYAGGYSSGYGEGRGYDRSSYGAGAVHRGGGEFRGHPRDYDRQQGYRQQSQHQGRDERDRGFFERAGDEVRSWFGDEEAERRRERDQRYDEHQGNHERWADRSKGDDHYHQWRRQRIAELDRDYDEYRQENAQRFHNEFSNWRSERQGQRDSLSRVTEHMDVVGSDGVHVGTVDKVRGDRIILTKSDAAAGGHHHSIPSRWVQTVDDKVTLRKTADEAKAHWKDEEQSGAMFGDGSDDKGGNDTQNWRSGGNLNRSFSGTY